MFSLVKVFSGLSKVTGRTGLMISKHSPEILLGMGIVGTVASTIMACKSTLKVEALLDEHKYQMDKIKKGKETLSEEKYSEQDYQKDLAVRYTKTVVGFIKLYGPAVTLGVASMFCFISGHGIMRKRNVALAAAYKAVEEGFAAYRKRVIQEHGEEADYMYKNGIYKEEVIETTVDENTGEVKATTVTRTTIDPNNPSMYARWFDEGNVNWDKEPSSNYNYAFISGQQRYWNQVLLSKGHVFLNQVYESLGFDHTKAGSVVGWYLGHGDSKIDFGIFDGNNERKRAFVNGDERNILLDFNVDGPIYDYLP